MKKKNLIILIIIILFFVFFLIDMWIFEPDDRFFTVIIFIIFVISLIAGLVSPKIEKKHKKIYDSMVPIECEEPSIENNEVYRFTNDKKTKIICIYKNGNLYKYTIFIKVLDDDFYNYCKYYYWTVFDNRRASLFDTKEKAFDQALKDIGIENNN